ncbi:hypothetical protein [Burkholderia cenocepacia]|uniref:hypothetical protein n=1 Tax=Burkholderia cenocepacia TaxID=95486 RepID=UPI002AB76C72|nr:hypothetical protein [Burkholderia cenocepacia]
MTEANYTHGNAEVQSIRKGPHRTPDVAGVLAFFVDRANLKSMDNDELEFLAGASEQASGEAVTLRDVVSGLGCLISEDQTRAGTQSGSLWSNDLPTLLWFIANQIDSIGQLAYIGSEADYQLRTRAQAAAAVKKEASRG